MFGPPPSDVLASVIGARLDRADVQWHVVPGQEDSLIRFWLTFTDGNTFGFHVGADGEVLDVIAETCWDDEDMGRYGRLEVRPAATGSDPPASAVGQRLVGVDDLFDLELSSPIGARLRFERAELSVADWEDELHWADGDLPPAVAARPR
jgi:hypothetical protein